MGANIVAWHKKSSSKLSVNACWDPPVHTRGCRCRVRSDRWSFSAKSLEFQFSCCKSFCRERRDEVGVWKWHLSENGMYLHAKSIFFQVSQLSELHFLVNFFLFLICTTNKPVSKWVFPKQSEVRLHGRTGRFWTQLLCVLEDLVSKQQSANSSTGRGEGELKKFDRGCGQSVFVTFCSRQAVTLLILCGCFHLFPFWSSVNLSGIASRFN